MTPNRSFLAVMHHELARRILVGLLVVAAAGSQVSACGKKERAPLGAELLGQDPVPQERLPQPTSAFVERSCWRKLSGHSEQCGTVAVPESPGSENLLEVGVVRVFSDADEPAFEPIVYLDGGPGSAVIGNLDLAFPSFEDFAKDRDVIFIDQRGTGVTRPVLSCGHAQDLADCYEQVSETSNPAEYTTAASARDIDLVRQALGYEKWNLLGISYGSRLGLTLMRDFPQGLAAVVLDGIVPLEVDLLARSGTTAQHAFELAFASCQADADCKGKYPDSMARLRELATQLNKAPISACDVDITGDSFVNILFNLLYSPLALVYVPQLIDSAARGEFELFQQLACKLGQADVAFGMHLSILCSEELPFTSQEAIFKADQALFPELVAGLSSREYVEHCASWPVPAASARENEPVRTALPALLLAGYFDPVTPPDYAELVRASLANSQYFLVTDESHGASLSRCGIELVRAFLKAPQSPVSPSCLGELLPPEFQALGSSPQHGLMGRRLKFATERPDRRQIDLIRDDLKRRVLL